jgi:peptidoglycan/xylan/chitin deacetylase (PgdA/CDA1 family)
MFGDDSIIPVIMFHSVGLENENWVFSHVSEPYDCFEDKISALVRSGYRFLFWDELYDYMCGRTRITQKSIMLTFDDGYLDNWVYVYPILKKYGAKATIFVNPEFVDPVLTKRPTIEDVSTGKIPMSDLNAKGFLSWNEMREMQLSGLVDIQSHSLTHTWYFSSPEPVDFFYPDCFLYPWLSWNKYPESKPYYITENQSNLIALGTPVYSYQKALIVRRYFPPTEVKQGMVEYVIENGRETFFAKEGWKKKLQNKHAALMNKFGKNASVETENEYKKRIFHELEKSKSIIEKNLEKQVRYICWPGGGYNEIVLKLAKEAGYRAWTLASKDMSDFRNRPDANPGQIKRVSSFNKYRSRGKGKEMIYADGRYFLSGVERHKGSVLHKWIGRYYLISNRLKNLFQGI